MLIKHLFIAIVLSSLPVYAASKSAFPRIRAADGSLARIIWSGYARSQSFRAIVDRIEKSDVIVHIEPMIADRGARGLLRFVTHSGGFRYLRVRIAMPSSPRATIALLGHELEHAAEVAADASVIDQESFERMYRRIADRCTGDGRTRTYDTRAAREAGDRIFAELRSGLKDGALIRAFNREFPLPSRDRYRWSVSCG